MSLRHREHRTMNLQGKTTASNIIGITGYTILTAATAHALLNGHDYDAVFHDFIKKYRKKVHGLHIENRYSLTKYSEYAEAYVSPLAWSSDKMEKVMIEVERYTDSLACPESIVVECRCSAAACFRARTGASKKEVAQLVAGYHNCTADWLYGLVSNLEGLQSCKSSVLVATSAFLNSHTIKDALDLAIRISGGNGRVTAVTASLADAYYGPLPYLLWLESFKYLDSFLDSVFDDFNYSFVYPSAAVEVRTGQQVLLPEAPEEWKRWPVFVSVGFTLYEGFSLSHGLFKEYKKNTMYDAAVKLFEDEKKDYIFPAYGITTEGVTPCFEWYVSWPLQRRGSFDKIIYRENICGAEGWAHSYENTLAKFYLLPTTFSFSTCTYVPSPGILMLDVGGRTKEQAVENWYKLARPLRRILKKTRNSTGI